MINMILTDFFAKMVILSIVGLIFFDVLSNIVVVLLLTIIFKCQLLQYNNAPCEECPSVIKSKKKCQIKYYNQHNYVSSGRH